MTMLLGQGILTAACVLLGLCPTLFLKLLDPITEQFTGQALSGQSVRRRACAFGGRAWSRDDIHGWDDAGRAGVLPPGARILTSETSRAG